MYKIASQNAQGRRDRILPRHVAAAPVVLSDEQRRQNLVSIVKQIQAEILETTDKARRKELGRKQFEIQTQINAIRAKPRIPEAKDHFIDAAREQLTFLQFDRIMREAVRRSGNEPVGDPR